MSTDLTTYFDKIDKILRRDDGLSTPLHYVEQTSWILFLKFLEDLEKSNSDANELAGIDYHYVIPEQFRWSAWAVPKKNDGSIDHNKKLQGDDLIDFVNNKLFKHLSKLGDVSESNSLAFKVGEIFSGIKQLIEDGKNLRDIIEIVDNFKFNSSEDKHEMSNIYEDRIKQMGNAGRSGGEYYTPRPLIEAMVKVINPQVGEVIFDPSCGSGGFLAEAYKFLISKDNLTTEDVEFIKYKALIGKEKKALPFIIGNMHLILSGIPSPNIIRTNTLSENVMQIESKDKVDIILANPPFGGDENESVQFNFPIKTSATENMFMQYFIKNLKQGGRAAIVIKNTFLTNDDNATKAIRQELLTECNLHTILDMPKGTFLGAGVQTVVLFFIKGEATKDIWYYQLNPGRNLGKTNALNINDFKDFLDLSLEKPDSENSWIVKHDDLDKDNYDLAVLNPNKVEEVDNRTPQEIIAEIEELDVQAAKALKAIKELL